MDYNIKVPKRDLAALFGNCYPTLPEVPTYKLVNYISALVDDEVGGRIKIDDNIRNKHIEFVVQQQGMDSTQVATYKTALRLERWLADVPKLGTFAPPRWYTNWMWSSPRSDIFCVDDIDKLELMKWLKASKLRPRDFQFFTKFGKDISIAFRNQEIATMFKLQFAEHV